MIWAQEIEELDRRGFTQEHYRELDHRFTNWNRGVWQHQWTLVKGAPCDLCGSIDPAVQVLSQRVCFACLNEFPHTTWHPTGAVRPKLTTLLTHAVACSKH